MNKYIYDNTNGLWYERNGDYYIPCLTLEDEHPIGVWGRKRLEYLREFRPALFARLVTTGKLYHHLPEIDSQARSRFNLLVEQLAEAQGITEQLKAQDQLAWVGSMNNIRSAAEEIIDAEIIFV